MEYTSEEQARIDLMAKVVNAPGEGRPAGSYATASDWEMRQLYAEAWFNVGFRDPEQVSPWIAEGIFDAEVAADAIRLGYRPEDPWVKRSHASAAFRDTTPITPPGKVAAFRNRARARRTWRADEAKRLASEASARRQAEQMVEVMRETSFDEGFGLSTLDLLYGTGGTIRDLDVIRGFNELMTQIDAMKTQHDRDGQLDEDNASNVSHFLLMAGVVENTLDVCTPEEQQTMTSQLATAKAWLESVKVP